MWKVFLCVILGLEALLMLLTQLKDNTIEENNPSYNTLNAEPPLIIGHRGASGFLPGHTLAGYLLAIEQGADVIEPDLVMTKDGVLVCRHEPLLSPSTNIKSIPEFAQRKKWKIIGGSSRHDWFVEDFTLEEIKKIGVIQTNLDRAQEYNGVFDIPTFEEVIELVKTKSAELNKRIIIYPEIKHPTFHKDSGLPIVEKLLEILDREGWNHKDSPVYLQSTEVSTLQEIRSRSTVKLMQVFLGCKLDKEGRINTDPGFCNQPYDFMKNKDKRTYSYLATDEGLDFLKTYADIIGVWTPFVIPFTFQDFNNDDKPDDLNGDGIIDFRDFTALPPTDLVERAHKRGLLVHVYTTKNEPSTLLSNYEGDPMKEYEALFKAGVDGVFADFPTTALTARKLYF